MATVNIAFMTAGGVSGAMPVFNAEPLLVEDVTSSGTSAQSSAAPVPCFVRVIADGAVRVAFGPNPTATTSDLKLVPNQPLDLAVARGHKVAVIDG